jgi:hypothetical protein
MTIHTIAYQTRVGTQVQSGETRYEEEELAEVFTEAERAKLEEGKVVIRVDRFGAHRYIDATVIAQMAINKSFGDY